MIRELSVRDQLRKITEIIHYQHHFNNRIVKSVKEKRKKIFIFMKISRWANCKHPQSVDEQEII